jgi:hypothetical protein
MLAVARALAFDPRHVRPTILRFLFAAALLALSVTPAGAEDEPVTLNFVNADIEAVV